MDWTENSNGNFVTEDDHFKTTVFLDKRGQWRGIRDEHITDSGYETAEEAMAAIDSEQVDFIKFRPRVDTTDWKPAKRGGFYRLRNDRIITVKQARTGTWYVSVDGRLVEGYWLKSSEAAIRCADSLSL